VNFDWRILILFAIHAYYYLLFLYIILSLVQSIGGITIPDALRPAANFLYDICEPFLRLFRRFLPTVRLGGMGLDLSPILAFLFLAYIVTPIATKVLFPHA
jgi:YggT family protein